MPRLLISTHAVPWYMRNGQLQTLYPALFRRTLDLAPDERVRLETPDDDFIDVDWYRAAPRPGAHNDRVVILSHGLEGHSRRGYIRGMAKACLACGWDAAARNFRGCSGEPNRQKRLYHSGETDDLDLVIRHAVDLGYRQVVLVGFSMGGNQTLKYLGENPNRVPAEVAAAATFSVPCDLVSANDVLSQPTRCHYMAYFMRTLRLKIREKHSRFPDYPSIHGLDHMRTFAPFDERFTAPLFGFASALDYWQKASCLPFLPHIRVPALLVNAADDPFLSPACTPHALAASHPKLLLEVPTHGGHVGFTLPGSPHTWAEGRVATLLTDLETLGHPGRPAEHAL